MPSAFISYVKEDAEAVNRIATVLREFEINVWLDKTSLKPGLRWQDQIRHGISEGDFFIACFSEAYVNRSKTYMNEELTLAIEELRQRPTDRAWFIPVKLNACEIPDRSIGAGETLRSIQWVDMTADWTAGMEKILSVIVPGSERIPRLIAQLDHESARRRIEAIEALGRLGPLAERAVPRLLTMIDSESKSPLGYSVLASIHDVLPLIASPENCPASRSTVSPTKATARIKDHFTRSGMVISRATSAQKKRLPRNKKSATSTASSDTTKVNLSSPPVPKQATPKPTNVASPRSLSTTKPKGDPA
jgi:hypothetical protein